MRKTDQILTLDGGGVEGEEKVVTGLPQLADGDVRRAVDDSGLVILQD